MWGCVQAADSIQCKHDAETHAQAVEEHAQRLQEQVDTMQVMRSHSLLSDTNRILLQADLQQVKQRMNVQSTRESDQRLMLETTVRELRESNSVLQVCAVLWWMVLIGVGTGRDYGAEGGG